MRNPKFFQIKKICKHLEFNHGYAEISDAGTYVLSNEINIIEVFQVGDHNIRCRALYTDGFERGWYHVDIQSGWRHQHLCAVNEFLFNLVCHIIEN